MKLLVAILLTLALLSPAAEAGTKRTIDQKVRRHTLESSPSMDKLRSPGGARCDGLATAAPASPSGIPSYMPVIRTRPEICWSQRDQHISGACSMKLGSKMSAESRAKMSAAHMGNASRPAGWKHTAEAKAKMSAARGGELHPGWKGNAAGYNADHYRHGKVLPRVCAHADDSCAGSLHAAFRHDTPEEFIKVDVRGRSYSPRPEDYMRLCHSHHKRYDYAHEEESRAQTG